MNNCQQKEAPNCKPKKKSWPECQIHPNTFPFTGRTEMFTLLPSPFGEWSDYCQTMADVAAKIASDQKYVVRILRRKEERENVDKQ